MTTPTMTENDRLENEAPPEQAPHVVQEEEDEREANSNPLQVYKEVNDMDQTAMMG